MKVLDTFEKLHDMEIRKSRLERISLKEPPPGSPNFELESKTQQEITDFPGPSSGQFGAKMNEKCFDFLCKGCRNLRFTEVLRECLS